MSLAGELVPEDVLRSIAVFFMFYMMLYTTAVLVLTALGMNLIVAISGTAACLGNVGPGLAEVGPYGNFGFIPTAGKWVLIICMIAGRLELYSLLVLFTRAFWRR